LKHKDPQDEFNLAMPDDLKAEAAKMARLKGIPLETFILEAIHEKLERQDESQPEREATHNGAAH
jgi:predicted HicB family RNase H-like nuclease